MQESLIRPHEMQPELSVLDDRLRVLASLEQAGGQYEMFLVEGPEGSGPPPHHHPWEGAYFIVEGELDVQVGGAHAHVAQGAYVRIPADATHTFRVTSQHARFLALTLPAKVSGLSAERFFRGMQEEVPLPPPSFDLVLAVAARYGVTIDASNVI